MDNTYNIELERRTTNFAKHLERMQHRSKIETRDNCFCVFMESAAGFEGGSARVTSKAKELVMAGSPLPPGSAAEFETSGSWPEDGWRDGADPRSRRFVQFAFLTKYFIMDLPRNTLTKDEAVRLVNSRSGFFYLRDNPTLIDSPTSSAQIRAYDPFCKAYIERDERSAAADMVFVFFELWHFPIDMKLYLTAFSGKRTGVLFEKDFPVG